MIEFIQNNLVLIIGGTVVGALIGDMIGMIFMRSRRRLSMEEAIYSQTQTLIRTVHQCKMKVEKSRNGFDHLASLFSDRQEEDQAPHDLAQQIADAAAKIPALPEIPKFDREFSMLEQHQPAHDALQKLNSLETSSLNRMIKEFQTLITTTLNPAIENAAGQGKSFSLEIETLTSLQKGADEFIKTIMTVHDSLDTIVTSLRENRH